MISNSILYESFAFNMAIYPSCAYFAYLHFHELKNHIIEIESDHEEAWSDMGLSQEEPAFTFTLEEFMDRLLRKKDFQCPERQRDPTDKDAAFWDSVATEVSCEILEYNMKSMVIRADPTPNFCGFNPYCEAGKHIRIYKKNVKGKE